MKRFLTALFVVIPFFAYSQDTVQEEVATPCVQNIELAQQRYDEGRIQDIQPLLGDCLARGEYDKAQKSQVLRLLTLAYIFLEDEDNAEATMLELLQTNHEFQVNSSIDPTEFINLHDRFRYKPLFNVGIRYIANLSQPMVTELNSTLDLGSGRPTYNINSQIGIFGLGLNFEYEFYENFVLYPELHYRTMKINRTFAMESILTVANGSYENYADVTNTETLNWFSLPISVKYLLHLQNAPNIKFYVNLGGSIDYLLVSERPGDESGVTFPAASPVTFTVNTVDDKNRLNFAMFGGGGITYKIGEGFVSLEARYLYNFNKLQKPENIILPGDPQQINTYVQDDVYRLNHVAISIGYTANIYLPKQLR